jgi:hypothetical protein
VRGGRREHPVAVYLVRERRAFPAGPPATELIFSNYGFPAASAVSRPPAFSAVSSASATATFTSGFTPVSSQSVFEMGLISLASGTPIMKSGATFLNAAVREESHLNRSASLTVSSPDDVPLCGAHFGRYQVAGPVPLCSLKILSSGS